MSTFSVTRAANGQIVLSMQNLDKYAVKDAGVISGSVQFSAGQTKGGTDESVLQIGHTQDVDYLKFEATDSKNNLEFYGQNIDAQLNTKVSTPYSVRWDAQNSSLDATKSASSVILETGENSHDNIIKLGNTPTKSLGKYDNIVFDNGDNNTFVGSENSTNRIETSATSNGAVVKAGNGANDFFIGGTNGAFVGGKGIDNYITDKVTAKSNLMIGKEGNDVINDYGQNSLFIGGAGTDTANLYGKYGIANLGFNEIGNFTFGNGSFENSVFTGETQTDANGKVYNYKDILKLRGWSAAEFLDKSNVDNNPYYSLIKKDIEETLG